MVIYLDRTIASSHILSNPEMSEQWNLDTFGKCHQSIHGHNFRCEIWLEGQIDKDTGMVVNFNEIKKIIDSLDHKHLNDVVDFIPTVENLVVYFIGELKNVGSANSIKVRVWETDKAFAEDEWRTS